VRGFTQAPFGAFFILVNKNHMLEKQIRSRISPFVPLTVALGWLLPHLHLPWSGFHQQVWLSIVALVCFTYLLTAEKSTAWQWPSSALAVGMLALLPLLQHLFGLLPFRGPALLAGAYFLALALAILAGVRAYARWDIASADWLFQSMFLAGLTTSGLVVCQRYQWQPDDLFSFWSLIFVPGESRRPGGNLGQANLAATLMFWGVIAAYWLFDLRKKSYFRGLFFSVCALLMIFGIAFTQSRAAWLSSFLLALLLSVRLLLLIKSKPRSGEPTLRLHEPVLHAKRLTSAAWSLCAVLTLVMWFVVYAPSSAVVYSNLPEAVTKTLIPEQAVRIDVSQKSVNLRSIVYPEFFKASLKSPWWGYGAQQVGLIQADFDLPGIEIDGFHMQSHSLFLDLILWFGLPIGLLAFFALLAWIAYHAWQSRWDTRCALLFSVLLVMLVHSMVEWPHMMLNMLLPCGYIAGIIIQHNQARSGRALLTEQAKKNHLGFLQAGRALGFISFGLLTAFTAVLIKEYDVVEREYSLLRFEALKIGPKNLAQIENLYLLDHWQAYFEIARVKPQQTTTDELKRITKAVEASPTMQGMYVLGASYALSGDEKQSLLWMRRLNSVASKVAALEYAKKWDVVRISHRGITLPWPSTGVLANLPKVGE
jgi:O-antigen ligase